MLQQAFRFDPVELPPVARDFRREVRDFLGEHRTSLGNRRDYDQAFSRKMAERGWIGMTWPKQYGGSERTAFERYVMIEEMLGGRRPGGLSLDRRPAERAEHPALRHRRAEGLLPAPHRARRAVVLHRHER